MIGKLCARRSYQWFAVKLGRALGEVPSGVPIRGLGLFNTALVTWAVELRAYMQGLELTPT